MNTDNETEDTPIGYMMVKASLAKKLERERDDARNIAHDLAVELYSSQHIPEKSNAGRLIKKAMSLLPNEES